MACLSVKLTSAQQAVLSVAALVSASVNAFPQETAEVSAEVQQPPSLTVTTADSRTRLTLDVVTPVRLVLSDIKGADEPDEPDDPDEPIPQTARLVVTPMPESRLTVAAQQQTTVRVNALQQADVTVTTGRTATVRATGQRQVAISLRPHKTVAITVGEVCSICGGELYVLSSTDGPLRTKDGGFFLLNPNQT